MPVQGRLAREEAAQTLTPSCQPAVSHWLQSEIPIGLSSSDTDSALEGPKMTAEGRELQSRSLRREVNERIAELIAGFHAKAEEPVMTVSASVGVTSAWHRSR
jgi:hypothetical protein